ncbi:MAG TPA: beta-ketoacyl synthase N-terminal-like domain-containing protein, partial [Pseudonocardiaceae bacterium]|nr:beta-ketoacyl synthase N-terminal-like domain-containing protein [Pseudonocardiaceae bacterium]
MLSTTAQIARVGVMVPGAEDPAAVVAGRDTGPPPGDWFDAVWHLGRRGWKYQSPAVRYLVAATRLAVTGDELAGIEPPAGAVSIGTHDSVGRLHRQFDDALRAEGIRGLSPAELPGFSVNTPASHLAIAYDLHGFCLTLTNPLTAGIEALLHGAAAIRAGTVTRVLAGATEDTEPGGSIRPGACAILLTAAPAPMPDAPQADGPQTEP